jgi:hypothetical protein
MSPPHEAWIEVGKTEMIHLRGACCTVSVMPRVLLIGLVVLTAACGEKTFESLCASQVPPPAACMTDCNPAPGAATSCPGGFHCAPSGKCDTQCTATGGQCGDAYSCNSDGYCVSKPGGGSGGDDEPQIDADCPAVDVAATKTTPSIQLLIDRSGSMLHNFADETIGQGDPPHPGPEKWQTLVGALVGADGVVTKLADKAYLGASMFPSDACPAILESPRALNNKPTIQTLLNDPDNTPTLDTRNGRVIYTPTPKAIDAVVADFAENPPPQGSPPVILLATDGLPNNCVSTTPSSETESVAAATAAFEAKIKLYVLQVGTVMGASQHMQDMANAGLGIKPGQPNAKVFFGTSPEALATALQEIIGGTLSCALTLNKKINPDNARGGDVQLNGEHLTYGTEWTVENDNITLRLLGAVCERVKNSADAVISARFPCGLIIP